MQAYHYIIDSYTVQDGSATVVAKDFLILTDDKNSLAPRLSTGLLLADINDAVTAATLTPVGIGNAEYDASGYLVLSGKETVAYTRAGDALTITRAQLGSDPIEHKAGAAIQQVLHYAAVQPSEIMADLLTNYVPNFDPAWIDTAAWSADVDAYIARLYTAYIATPTPVVKLLNELIEQVSLVMSTNTSTQKILLQALRALTATQTIDIDSIVANSFATKEQPQQRASEVWTYYGQRNPLEPQEETRNYSCTVLTVDPDSAQDYNKTAVKQIFSRWILSTNRASVHQLNATTLARYRDPPRQFSFALFDTPPPVLGSSILLSHWMLVDDEGFITSVPVQITSTDISDPTMVKVLAEEANFIEQPDLGGGTGTGGTGDRYIYVDVAALNVNLRSLHDAIYTTPDSDTVAIFVVNATIGGARDSSSPAMNVGDWPVGADVRLVLNAELGSPGGRGGTYTPNGTPSGLQVAPGNGGTALYTRFPITVTNNSTIYAGGGGANFSYYFGFLGTFGFYEVWVQGGGGAGNEFGINGAGTNVANTDTPATTSAGGYITPTFATAGPAGGARGMDGAAGSIPNLLNPPSYVDILPGGSAGTAVDGDSFVTFSVLGTVTGARIN